jgi:hypothetical protein
MGVAMNAEEHTWNVFSKETRFPTVIMIRTGTEFKKVKERSFVLYALIKNIKFTADN